MKDILYATLASTISLSLLVACGQPMHARKTTSEDLLIRDYKQLTPRERQQFQSWAGRDDNMRKVIIPRATPDGSELPPAPPAGAPAAADSAKPAPAAGPAAPKDDKMQVAATDSTTRPPDFVPAPLTLTDDVKTLAEKIKENEQKVRLENQERLFAHNDIAENGAEAAREVILGMNVKITATSEKLAHVYADTLLLIAGKEFVVSGVAIVTDKTQLVDQKIANLVLSAKDDRNTPVLIKGVDMFTSCTRTNCSEIALFIKISYDGGKVVAATSTFGAVKDQELAALVASTLGDKVLSINEARTQLAQRGQAAAAANRTAAAPANNSGATAASGPVTDQSGANDDGITRAGATPSGPDIVVNVIGRRSDLDAHGAATEEEQNAILRMQEQQALEEAAARERDAFLAIQGVLDATSGEQPPNGIPTGKVVQPGAGGQPGEPSDDGTGLTQSGMERF